MKKYILPILILLAGLAISGSAAYYSVLGLSKLFAGAYIPVTIMASSLEFSKLVIASLLYTYRKTLPKLLKTYLIIAVIILMGITSIGIYGYLTSAYQTTLNKTEIVDSQILLLEERKESQNEQLRLYNEEKSTSIQDVNSLRSGLSNNIIQYKDKAGNIITTQSSSTRKSLEKQLDQSLERQTQINAIIEDLKVKVFEVENQISEVKTESTLSGELGPLKFVSELTGYDMNIVINWLLLLIIFVFDPLAISLIIAANFSFTQIKTEEVNEEKPENITPKEDIPTPPPSIPPRDEKQLNDPNTSSWKKNKLIQKYFKDKEDNIKRY
jgi:hypothetical protein